MQSYLCRFLWCRTVIWTTAFSLVLYIGTFGRCVGRDRGRESCSVGLIILRRLQWPLCSVLSVSHLLSLLVSHFFSLLVSHFFSLYSVLSPLIRDLSTHAQRGLRYLVCKCVCRSVCLSVCLSVCYHVFCDCATRQQNSDTNGFITTLASFLNRPIFV